MTSSIGTTALKLWYTHTFYLSLSHTHTHTQRVSISICFLCFFSFLPLDSTIPQLLISLHGCAPTPLNPPTSPPSHTLHILTHAHTSPPPHTHTHTSTPPLPTPFYFADELRRLCMVTLPQCCILITTLWSLWFCVCARVCEPSFQGVCNILHFTGDAVNVKPE